MPALESRKLDLQNLYSQSYSDTFYNAPVWEQVAIDRIIIPLFDLCSNEVTRFASIPFKCVQLTVDDSIRDSMLPSGSWTYFSKSEKLELHFDDVNARSYKIMRHNVLKLVKHPNLHVVLKWPIHVRDANPRQSFRQTRRNLRKNWVKHCYLRHEHSEYTCQHKQ